LVAILSYSQYEAVGNKIREESEKEGNDNASREQRNGNTPPHPMLTTFHTE